MPFYAVVGFDHPPHSMPLRDKVRPEHRQYMRQQGQMVRLAGALWDADNNQCGSVFVVEADNPQQVRDWFSREPFYRDGVYKDFHVIEWRMAMNQLDRKNWGPAAEPVR